MLLGLAPCACWAWSLLEVQFTMVKCYIPSCDIVAHVFLSGLVGRAQDWRAESSGFESGSGKKKKKVGLFLSSFTIVY